MRKYATFNPKEWREKNKERLRAYDKAKYPAKQAIRHAKTFEGRNCALCTIPLSHPIYGAKRTVKFCYTCSQDRRAKQRYWYAKKILKAKSRELQAVAR